jgi:hypothetical protein
VTPLPDAAEQRANRHRTQKTDYARHSDRDSINNEHEIAGYSGEQKHTETPSGQKI